MQRRFAALGARVNVGTLCQELLDNLSFTFLHRLVQRTLAAMSGGDLSGQQQRSERHAERNVPTSLNRDHS